MSDQFGRIYTTGFEEKKQGPAGYLLAETAKTLYLQPIGRQTVCIIGLVCRRLQRLFCFAPDPKSNLVCDSPLHLLFEECAVRLRVLRRLLYAKVPNQRLKEA